MEILIYTLPLLENDMNLKMENLLPLAVLKGKRVSMVKSYPFPPFATKPLRIS